MMGRKSILTNLFSGDRLLPIGDLSRAEVCL